MTSKQWWAATVVVPFLIAISPGLIAMAGNAETKQKADVKVTREELQATIKAITNRLENLELEQKRIYEASAAASLQQFTLMKMLIEKLAATNTPSK